MNDIPDIPDNMTPEEKWVWAVSTAVEGSALNRDRFLSNVRRIFEETPPTEPYRKSQYVEESFWAGRDPRTGELSPDKRLPGPWLPDKYVPLALR